MHQEKLEMKTKVSSFITANIYHIKIEMEENMGGKKRKQKKEGKFCNCVSDLQGNDNATNDGSWGSGLGCAANQLCDTGQDTAHIWPLRSPEVLVQPPSKQTHSTNSSTHRHLLSMSCSDIFTPITFRETHGRVENCDRSHLLSCRKIVSSQCP